jgi:hypothetical protein
MRFPEVTRSGDEVLAAAVRHRDDASEGHDRLVNMATAAVGTPAEDESADLRDAAQARLAASDAWVGWIEHGV